MSEKILELSQNDVIHTSSYRVMGLSKTFKADELINHIKNISREKYNTTDIFESYGNDCNVLREDGAGWQTGKIRISVEFIVQVEEEEMEESNLTLDVKNSPLDEIRQFSA
jgi:hypothetical protein